MAAVASSTSIALERRVTTGSHTIILVQLLPEITSRTFHDFESLDGALDGVVKMYERRLRELNPTVTEFEYELADLFKYLDSLAEIVFMVMDPKTLKYDGMPREWIKQQIYARMKRMAGTA